MRKSTNRTWFRFCGSFRHDWINWRADASKSGWPVVELVRDLDPPLPFDGPEELNWSMSAWTAIIISPFLMPAAASVLIRNILILYLKFQYLIKRSTKRNHSGPEVHLGTIGYFCSKPYRLDQDYFQYKITFWGYRCLLSCWLKTSLFPQISPRETRWYYLQRVLDLWNQLRCSKSHHWVQLQSLKMNWTQKYSHP